MSSNYIILVNWNGHEDTIECLESLLRMDNDDFRVVVVDNGSTDDSLEKLQRWASAPPGPARNGPVWSRLPVHRCRAPSIRVVTPGQLASVHSGDTRITIVDAGVNLGFAGANNLGLALADRDPDSRHFWVLNNDTVVAPDSLSTLVSHADSHPDQAIIGATLLYYDNPAVVQGVGGWLDAGRALSGHIGFGTAADRLPPPEEVTARLAYVMGASMFVKRELYQAVGGMSEDYFLYYEELDWAKRLPRGSRLGVCMEAVVYHKEGGSIGTSSHARPSDTSLYYSYTSAMRFYWKHERRHVMKATARIVYNLIAFAHKRDTAAMLITAHAIVDALLGRKRRGSYGSAEFRQSTTKHTEQSVVCRKA